MLTFQHSRRVTKRVDLIAASAIERMVASVRIFIQMSFDNNVECIKLMMFRRKSAGTMGIGMKIFL
jgi:hypothetical protein